MDPMELLEEAKREPDRRKEALEQENAQRWAELQRVLAMPAGPEQDAETIRIWGEFVEEAKQLHAEMTVTLMAGEHLMRSLAKRPPEG